MFNSPYWQQHFDWILNNVDDGIHLVNQEGITVFYNEKAAEIDGLERKQVIGKSVFNSFPSLTQETSTLIQVLQSGKTIKQKVQTYVNVKGKQITTINKTLPLFENNEIIGAVEIAKDITNIVQLHDQVLHLQQRLYKTIKEEADLKGSASFHFADLIGESKPFMQAISIATKAARMQSSVLITGPTGTGKELVAQSIHNAGLQRKKPFIAQNCAAVPAELLEGLLFGTTRGAFTGAVDRPGLFEQANEGTLFLDELNSLEISLQAKLLRVLQDGMVRRIGDTKEKKVNIRIIASMNIDPMEALEKGILRSDLFYRLNVVHIHLPPLVERSEDIPLLIQHFINKFNSDFHMNVQSVSEDALECLTNHPWRGNIRELRHAMESAYNMIDFDSEMIELEHLPPYLLKNIEEHGKQNIAEKYRAMTHNNTIKLPNLIAQLEQDLILSAYTKHSGNITKTAKSLGITRQALQYKLSKYDISKNFS